MPTLLWIIISTLAVSLCALTGVILLGLKDGKLNKILLNLVALSSGALLGGAFLHLMPEGVEELGGDLFFLLVLATLIFDLFLEKILHWRHCHKGVGCESHSSFGYMNLMGDTIHNFIDGLVIAAAFLISVPLGLVTTLAVALHEIPQEIGDFAVLIYAGFSKKKALFYNFLSATTVIVGGLVGWGLSQWLGDVTKFLLPVAAGGFIYIAVSDLLPELRKEVSLKTFFVNLIFILLGIGVVFLVKFLPH